MVLLMEAEVDILYRVFNGQQPETEAHMDALTRVHAKLRSDQDERVRAMLMHQNRVGPR